MTAQVVWSLPRRIGFRFVFLVGALVTFPFPVNAIPGADAIDSVLTQPLTWGAQWLATIVLGLPAPYPGPSGSGDRAVDYAQLLLVVILAALGTIVWSVLDRRRGAYPRLAEGARIVLRYYLAAVMLSYGFSKVVKSQFYDLSPGVLHQRLGDVPPMRLMWAFMGYSQPYTVFAGLAEVAGGALLLWRRTATLGALLVAIVMTNVVLMNLCYDVPAKLFSTRLLAIAIAIAWPDARRVLGAVLGRAAAELPPRPRMTRGRERGRQVAKLVLIALMVVDVYLTYGRRPPHDDHIHELYGHWIVDSFALDGVEHPPLTTDPVRWDSWSASPRYMQIWLMNGMFEGRYEPERGWYSLKVDPAAHTITVTVDDKQKTRETWTYSRPAPDRLIIDCVHRGKSLHVALHLEPEGVLMTRGFHWFNEVPYNR
ncbi:MAG TPA: DoxX family protein [Kofleriaceae bacterium]|jgi:uncharacterized membrane protein YphA (DoxX/SURF4 family)|nr:DoxX family protein [Kofleriaceae bacterium]